MVAIGLFVFFMVLLSIFAICFVNSDNNPQNNSLALKTNAKVQSRKEMLLNELANQDIYAEINCELIDTLSGLTSKENTLSNVHSKAVLLNEEKEFIVLVDYATMEYRIIEFRELVDCEIIENNDVIKKTSIGKAIIGGILAGGAGAIIGSTMGKNQHTIQSLQVRIITSSLRNSLVNLNLITAEVPKNSPTYIRCLEFANQIYAVCTAIIDRKSRTA